MSANDELRARVEALADEFDAAAQVTGVPSGTSEVAFSIAADKLRAVLADTGDDTEVAGAAAGKDIESLYVLQVKSGGQWWSQVDKSWSSNEDGRTMAQATADASMLTCRVVLLSRPTPAPVPVGVTDEQVEKAARAAAIHEDYDGCFERVDEWESMTPEDQSHYADRPDSDYEDCEWWRARARAALEAAALAAPAPVVDVREQIAEAIEAYLDPDHCPGEGCELCPLVRQLATLARTFEADQ